MADNIDIPYGRIGTKDEAGVHYQRTIFQAVAGGVRFDLPGSIINGLLVDVSRVTGNVAVTGPLTDVQLRAAAIEIIKGRTPLTGSAPASIAIGVASSVAVALNAARKGLTLVNTSANWISLAFGVPAVLYSGICLAPNGGSYTMGDYDFSTQEIRAIASAAASNLAIQEFV